MGSKEAIQNFFFKVFSLAQGSNSPVLAFKQATNRSCNHEDEDWGIRYLVVYFLGEVVQKSNTTLQSGTYSDIFVEEEEEGVCLLPVFLKEESRIRSQTE